MRVPVVMLTMLGCWGCQSTAQLETSIPAQVSTLNEDFQVVSRMGTSPVPFDPTIPVQRIAVYPKGRSPEYLVVVTPAMVRGPLKFPIQESTEAVESAVEYNRYLDLLLRAHRLVLRGDLDEGEKTLDKLEGLFDKTYGSMVLRGNIAVVRGDKVNAAKFLQMANQLYPNASIFGSGGGKP